MKKNIVVFRVACPHCGHMMEISVDDVESGLQSSSQQHRSLVSDDDIGEIIEENSHKRRFL